MNGSGGPDPAAWQVELVDEIVELGGERLCLLRPVDPTALLDEEAFAEDEFLPYWAELWPSARSLVEVLPDSLSGRSVLEIGCGLGLPSLVAARRGAEVTATDWSSEALELLALNARRNEVVLSLARLDWTRPPESLGAFDLVLAADVAYEHRNVAPLLALFDRLGCEVLLADPGRAAGTALLERTEEGYARTALGPGVNRLAPRRTRPS